MNIAFISCQVEGLDKNGDIGTATRYICEHLAAAGEHEIHLYHTGYPQGDTNRFKTEMKSLGIEIHYIHSDANAIYGYERRPYRVYEELRLTRHDVYIFHDYAADGFFCFLAKASGTAFRKAKLGLICHSPTLWCDQANRVFPDWEPKLSLYDMEKTCCECAEFIIGPSAYMLEWIRTQGWKLPENTFHIPYLVSSPGSFTSASEDVSAEVRELVFFGRLEERKGVKVFCDALNLLLPKLLSGRTVTFLGSVCGYDEEKIRLLLEPSLRQSGYVLQFFTDFDNLRGRDYLRRPGRLAVMPSLVDNSPCCIYECLENKLPFLASSAGGGRELVRPEYHDKCIFSPDKKSMASLLTEILTDGRAAIPRPAYTHENILNRWQDLFRSLQQKNKNELTITSPVKTKPLVSLILVHHDRPHLLKYSLQSCLDQDYPALEIILIDDGSSQADSLAYLDELEKTLPPRLRILRQENRYLGAARNAGVAEAKGEYVVFLDDDNIPLPDMVSRYVEAALYSGADAVSGMMRLFWEQEGPPGAGAEHNQFGVFWGGYQHYSAILVNHLGDAGGIFRLDALRKTGGFHECFGVGYEDWKMYVDIENAGGKIVSIPDMMYWYRVTNNSMIRGTDTYLNIMQPLDSYKKRLPAEWKYILDVLYGFCQTVNTLRDEHNNALNALRDEHNNAFNALRDELNNYPNYLKKIGKMVNTIIPKGTRRRTFIKIIARRIFHIIRKIKWAGR